MTLPAHGIRLRRRLQYLCSQIMVRLLLDGKNGKSCTQVKPVDFDVQIRLLHWYLGNKREDEPHQHEQ